MEEEKNANWVEFTVQSPDGASDQAKLILEVIAPHVLQSFADKNRDYGETSFDLGIAGQYAELWRKIGKLKGPMWEGKSLQFEQVDEILSDLIGHALLTLYFLHEEEAKRTFPVASAALKERRSQAAKGVAEFGKSQRKAAEAAIGIEEPQGPGLTGGLPIPGSRTIPMMISPPLESSLAEFKPDGKGMIPYTQKMYAPNKVMAIIGGDFLQDRSDAHHIPAIGCFNPHCIDPNHYYAKDMK